MNLGEIKTRCKYRLYLPDYNSIMGGETALTAHINDVIDELTRDANLESSYWSASTVANQRELTLPNDNYWITSVVITNSDGDDVPLMPTSIADLNGDNSSWKSAGNELPTHWYFRSPQIIGLSPKPDAIYTVGFYGFQITNDLSGSSDTNFLTRIFPDVIIEGVKAIYWDSTNDKRAAKQEGKYQFKKRDFVAYVKRVKGRVAGFKLNKFREWRRDY